MMVPELKEYEVWSEGYAVTGGASGAQFHGRVKAESWREACDKLLGGEADYDRDRMTLWGCKLFSDEGEAREGFG